MQPESANKSVRISTLVSIGQHPKSGRARRSDQDSKAVELALRLALSLKAGIDNTEISLLHAGDSSDALTSAVLREYLGMGIDAMNVINQPAGSDVIDALVASVRSQQPDMVLTGTRSESGEGSGMTPYLLGQQLGWPVVPAAVDIKPVGNGQYEVLQALPRGQRRLLKVRAPFVASVDAAAAESRQTAWAAGQRGELNSQFESTVRGDSVMDSAQVEPARKRPKRIAAAKKAKSAADRFKAATVKSGSKGGAVMVNESAEEKAEAIYQMLLGQGVLKG